MDNDPLPGAPGKALSSVWSQLSPAAKAALRSHLLAGTSAEWLAITLTNAGYRIGASSIKAYRRSLRQEGVQL